ncbi:MAG: 50S ribosomal protein L11 methyltransferase, partial [Candidatus Omnitrophica bacterium]|nr:50S ribosomal protein L11 methyltransferase [Candidatus Omnitrophota bacterium]
DPHHYCAAMWELFARKLENIIEPGDRVLDMGTGTGILGIRSYQLGASDVVSTDINSEALMLARINFRRFGFPSNLLEGDLFNPLKDDRDSFDKIIFAPPWFNKPQERFGVSQLDYAFYDPGYTILTRFIKDAAAFLKKDNPKALCAVYITESQERPMLFAMKGSGLKTASYEEFVLVRSNNETFTVARPQDLPHSGKPKKIRREKLVIAIMKAASSPIAANKQYGVDTREFIGNAIEQKEASALASKAYTYIRCNNSRTFNLLAANLFRTRSKRLNNMLNLIPRIICLLGLATIFHELGHIITAAVQFSHDVKGNLGGVLFTGNIKIDDFNPGEGVMYAGCVSNFIIFLIAGSLSFICYHKILTFICAVNLAAFAIEFIGGILFNMGDFAESGFGDHPTRYSYDIVDSKKNHGTISLFDRLKDIFCLEFLTEANEIAMFAVSLIHSSVLIFILPFVFLGCPDWMSNFIELIKFGLIWGIAELLIGNIFRGIAGRIIFIVSSLVVLLNGYIDLLMWQKVFFGLILGLKTALLLPFPEDDEGFGVLELWSFLTTATLVGSIMFFVSGFEWQTAVVPVAVVYIISILLHESSHLILYAIVGDEPNGFIKGEMGFGARYLSNQFDSYDRPAFISIFVSGSGIIIHSILLAIGLHLSSGLSAVDPWLIWVNASNYVQLYMLLTSIIGGDGLYVLQDLAMTVILLISSITDIIIPCVKDKMGGFTDTCIRKTLGSHRNKDTDKTKNSSSSPVSHATEHLHIVLDNGQESSASSPVDSKNAAIARDKISVSISGLQAKWEEQVAQLYSEWRQTEDRPLLIKIILNNYFADKVINTLIAIPLKINSFIIKKVSVLDISSIEEDIKTCRDIILHFGAADTTELKHDSGILKAKRYFAKGIARSERIKKIDIDTAWNCVSPEQIRAIIDPYVSDLRITLEVIEKDFSELKGLEKSSSPVNAEEGAIMPEEYTVESYPKEATIFMASVQKQRNSNFNSSYLSVPFKIRFEECVERVAQFRVSVSPSEDAVFKNSELDCLNVTAIDHYRDHPPAGSFGQIHFSIFTIAGKTVIYIKEVQCSIGFRHMKPSEIREPYRNWAKAAIDEIILIAKNSGIEDFYASTPYMIEEYYIKKIGVPVSHGNLRECYMLPFRKDWQKRTVSFDHMPSQTFNLWHYEPQVSSSPLADARFSSSVLEAERLISAIEKVMPSIDQANADWSDFDRIVEELKTAAGVKAVVVVEMSKESKKVSTVDGLLEDFMRPAKNSIKGDDYKRMGEILLPYWARVLDNSVSLTQNARNRSLAFLRHTLHNLEQHVKNGVSLIVIQQFDDGVTKISVIDNGTGFIDKQGNRVSIEDAVQYAKSFGIGGELGKGLYYAVNREAHLSVIHQPRTSAIIIPNYSSDSFVRPKPRIEIEISTNKQFGTTVVGYFYNDYSGSRSLSWRQSSLISELSGEIRISRSSSPIIISSILFFSVGKAVASSPLADARSSSPVAGHPRLGYRNNREISSQSVLISPEMLPKRQVYPRSRVEKGVNRGVELRREIERNFAGNIFTLRNAEDLDNFTKPSIQLRNRGAVYIPDCVKFLKSVMPDDICKIAKKITDAFSNYRSIRDMGALAYFYRITVEMIKNAAMHGNRLQNNRMMAVAWDCGKNSIVLYDEGISGKLITRENIVQRLGQEYEKDWACRHEGLDGNTAAAAKNGIEFKYARQMVLKGNDVIGQEARLNYVAKPQEIISQRTNYAVKPQDPISQRVGSLLSRIMVEEGLASATFSSSPVEDLILSVSAPMEGFINLFNETTDISRRKAIVTYLKQEGILNTNIIANGNMPKGCRAVLCDIQGSSRKMVLFANSILDTIVLRANTYLECIDFPNVEAVGFMGGVLRNLPTLRDIDILGARRENGLWKIESVADQGLKDFIGSHSSLKNRTLDFLSMSTLDAPGGFTQSFIIWLPRLSADDKITGGILVPLHPSSAQNLSDNVLSLRSMVSARTLLTDKL